jgi:hypothetical protein
MNASPQVARQEWNGRKRSGRSFQPRSGVDSKTSEPCNELQSAKLIVVEIRESEERHVET